MYLLVKEKCSLALHYTTHYTQLNATQTPADHRLSTYVIVQRYRIIYDFFLEIIRRSSGWVTLFKYCTFFVKGKSIDFGYKSIDVYCNDVCGAAI